MYKIGKTNSLKINEFSGEGHLIISEDFIDSRPASEKIDILGDWINDLQFFYEQAYCQEYHDEHMDGECPSETNDWILSNSETILSRLLKLISDVREHGSDLVPLCADRWMIQFDDGRIQPHENLGQALERTQSAAMLSLIAISKANKHGAFRMVPSQVIPLRK